MHAGKSPRFHSPRLYAGKPISKRQYDEETLSPLPYWVRCKVCKGKPEGLNWLKPLSPDKDCKIFIHLNCMSKDV